MGLSAKQSTVGGHLHQWLAEVVKGSVSPNTFACYENYVKNHLKPELGVIRLNDLTPQHVQKLMN